MNFSVNIMKSRQFKGVYRVHTRKGVYLHLAFELKEYLIFNLKSKDYIDIDGLDFLSFEVTTTFGIMNYLLRLVFFFFFFTQVGVSMTVPHAKRIL